LWQFSAQRAPISTLVSFLAEERVILRLLGSFYFVFVLIVFDAMCRSQFSCALSCLLADT
jgi:hypothetical protein